jgi:hypothetical protein
MGDALQRVVKKCGLVKHVERKYDATTPNICCLRTPPSLDVPAYLIMTTPLRVELPVLLQNYVESTNLRSFAISLKQYSAAGLAFDTL